VEEPLRTAARNLSFVALAGGLALALAACSSTSAPSATGTSGSSAAGSGTLAPETATETEFLSPSKDISCEIDANAGPTSQSQALCLTISPPRSVVLKTDGSLTECNGQQCLSNAGEKTPTLAYGQSITLGPFSCRSSTAGITCTLRSGAGFLMATAGVTPQGSATVSSS
jgi:hypothetical protein